jgi:hypothetical protein
MNEYGGCESLLLIIGELLYKNQLLRQAVASRDETIDRITRHLTSAKVAACSCGAGSQLAWIRDGLKLRGPDSAKPGNSNFREPGEVVPRTTATSVDSIAPSPGPAEK